MKLTAEELREIEKRADEASRGPWEINKYTDLVAPDDGFGELLIIAREIGTGSNGLFAAASRTDVPRLLAHIKALEEENKQYAVTTFTLAGAVRKASEDFVEEGMYDTAEYYRRILKGTTTSCDTN